MENKDIFTEIEGQYWFQENEISAIRHEAHRLSHD